MDIRNVELSLPLHCKDKKKFIVAPRTGTLPSWSSICKNIFSKAGFTIDLILKTQYFILRDDTGMGDTNPNMHNLYDRMTEEIFEIVPNQEDEPIEYEIIRNMTNQPLYNINTSITDMSDIERREYNRSLIAKLDELNESHGLSLSDEDKTFIRTHGEDWDDFMLSVYDIAQSNSEHCRHHFFNGDMYYNSTRKEQTLFDLVKEPYKQIQRSSDSNNSTIAFSDNSSAIKGSEIPVPRVDGITHQYDIENTHINYVCTAETHNFPTAISPFPGAATGIGGRIRDVQATGRGAQPVCSSAGYCVGKLFLSENDIKNEYPENITEPTKILIEASNGASDYGNKFGEPIVNGFTRSFRGNIDGERREWVKPIMFTGGLGIMRDIHTHKVLPNKDMIICKIGGPVYKIGLGGSTASSRVADNKNAELDYNAVQRAILRWNKK